MVFKIITSKHMGYSSLMVCENPLRWSGERSLFANCDEMVSARIFHAIQKGHRMKERKREKKQLISAVTLYRCEYHLLHVTAALKSSRNEQTAMMVWSRSIPANFFLNKAVLKHKLQLFYLVHPCTQWFKTTTYTSLPTFQHQLVLSMMLTAILIHKNRVYCSHKMFAHSNCIKVLVAFRLLNLHARSWKMYL